MTYIGIYKVFIEYSQTQAQPGEYADKRENQAQESGQNEA